jgi:lysophospholipase L1-like esterase
MIKTLAFCSLFALAACGGGGSSGASDEPRKTAIGEACSLVVPVVINMYGDSTQYGVDSFTYQQANPTAPQVLQADMDAQFGPGAVVVNNYGVPTTKAWQFSRQGAANIELVNYGINDQDLGGGVPIDQYEADLRSIAASSPLLVFETPNATPGYNPRFAAYVQRMRDVALSIGAPLIDVNAYVQSVPNWESYFADLAHPNTAMYGMIAHNALTPALVPMVKKLRCEE